MRQACGVLTILRGGFFCFATSAVVAVAQEPLRCQDILNSAMIKDACGKEMQLLTTVAAERIDGASKKCLANYVAGKAQGGVSLDLRWMGGNGAAQKLEREFERKRDKAKPTQVALAISNKLPYTENVVKNPRVNATAFSYRTTSKELAATVYFLEFGVNSFLVSMRSETDVLGKNAAACDANALETLAIGVAKKLLSR